MNYKLKYLKLFEYDNQDYIKSKEFNDFLDSIEFSYWDKYPKNEAFVDSIDEDSWSEQKYNITYSLKYGNEDDDDDDDDGFITIDNLNNFTKWTEIPFGKYFDILYAEDFYNFELTISNNKNLIELDSFHIRAIDYNDENLSIFIEGNKKLKLIDFVYNYYDNNPYNKFISLKENPNLITTLNLPHNINIAIQECPKLNLATILTLLKDDDVYNINSLLYINNEVSIKIDDDSDADDINNLIYDTAFDEIFNIIDFNDLEYIDTIPNIIDFFDMNDSIITHIFKHSNSNVINKVVDKKPELTPYLHLNNPKYKNTGARGIAKMNTGRYLGVF